ncbi:MAG: DTW domain-containing protein [Alkalimonas sp.]|nr:DTW domain-containing protein [Alkalimonas sp.]
MTAVNSVLALRERELANSKRVFVARGSKLKRCLQCLLAEANCICSHKPAPQAGAAFCFIMYQGEAYKPSNTGRIIADVMADNYAFLWQRTEPNADLLALLQHPDYAPVLIFPHQYVDAKRCLQQPAELTELSQGKTPLFVMLDGTWREAKKMLKSDYLATLPVLSITPNQQSAYMLREAAQPHQLSTAEVAVEVLHFAGLTQTATALNSYYQHFLHAYRSARPHHPLNRQARAES